MAKTKSKAKEKHPSKSDKLVEYLKVECGARNWTLAELALHLFPDHEDAPPIVREAHERSTMNAFNTARAKLLDHHDYLVIPKECFKGSTKVAEWAFATRLDQDKIKLILDRREKTLKHSGERLVQIKELAVKKGWLGESAAAIAH